jgi:hypothetical protein
MIKTDEDDEFERIEHENEMKSGQPYHFESKRGWVGLTDDEFKYCVELKNLEAIVLEVEAKLKEKNT